MFEHTLHAKLTLKLGQQTEQIELNVCVYATDRQGLFNKSNIRTHSHNTFTHKQAMSAARVRSIVRAVRRSRVDAARERIRQQRVHVRSTAPSMSNDEACSY